MSFYTGVACHDHWKQYYKYGCTHALCNAHNLRELERSWDQDKQECELKRSELLKEINRVTIDAGGCLKSEVSMNYRKRYREILHETGDECPPPEPKKKGCRSRTARTKSRNLLERVRDFEDDVLRFMNEKFVPFTNNQAENDL